MLVFFTYKSQPEDKAKLNSIAALKKKNLIFLPAHDLG